MHVAGHVRPLFRNDEISGGRPRTSNLLILEVHGPQLSGDGRRESRTLATLLATPSVACSSALAGGRPALRQVESQSC